MNKLMILGLMLLAAAGASGAADTYLVEIRVLDGEELVAQPVMKVVAGEQSSISLGDDFNLALVVAQTDEGLVEVSSRLKMNGQLYTPRLVLHEEEKAAIGIGSMQMFVKVSDPGQP